MLKESICTVLWDTLGNKMSDVITVQPLSIRNLDEYFRGLHISKMLLLAPNLYDFDFKGCLFYKCVFNFPSSLLNSMQAVTVDCTERVDLENVLIDLDFDTATFEPTSNRESDFGKRVERYLESEYPLIEDDLCIKSSFNATSRENAICINAAFLYGYRVAHLGISNTQKIFDAFNLSLEDELNSNEYYKDNRISIDSIIGSAYQALTGKYKESYDQFEAASFSYCNFDQSDWRYFSSTIHEIEHLVDRIADSVVDSIDFTYLSETNYNKKNQIKVKLHQQFNLFTFKSCSFIGAKGIWKFKDLPYFTFIDCVFDNFDLRKKYDTLRLNVSVLQNRIVTLKNLKNNNIYKQVEFIASYVSNVAFKGLNLYFLSFFDTLFKNVSFEFAMWEDCLINKCTFINCNFNNTLFKDSYFNECTFINCTFNEISVAFSQQFMQMNYNENPSLFSDPKCIDNLEISIKGSLHLYEGTRVFKFSQPTLYQVPQAKVQDKLNTLDIRNITYNESEHSQILKESNILGYHNGLTFEIYEDLPTKWFSKSREPLTRESTMPNFDIGLLDSEQLSTLQQYIDFEDDDLISVKRNRRKYRRNDDN